MRYLILIVVVAIMGVIIIIADSRIAPIQITNVPVQGLNEDLYSPSTQIDDGQSVESADQQPIDIIPNEANKVESPVIDTFVGDLAVNPAPEEETISYDSILDKANEHISALQSSCQGALLSIYVQYVGTSEKAGKRKLVKQGKDELNRCDASFDEIMTNLSTSLTTNNMPTTIISTYRAEYTKQKALAQSMLD